MFPHHPDENGLGRVPGSFHRIKDHHLGIKVSLTTVGQIPIEHVQIILLDTSLGHTHKFFGFIQRDPSTANVPPAAPPLQLDPRGHESVLRHTACEIPRASATSRGDTDTVLAALPWCLFFIQTTSSAIFCAESIQVCSQRLDSVPLDPVFLCPYDSSTSLISIFFEPRA